MTNQKNGSNGTATTNGTAKQVPTTSTLAVVKKEEEKKPVPVTPLTQRLDRINELFELNKKYNTLQNSRQKLSEFKMKKGQENISLTIDDDENNVEFTTSNPDVIKKVLACVSGEIDSKIAETESQLIL